MRGHVAGRTVPIVTFECHDIDVGVLLDISSRPAPFHRRQVPGRGSSIAHSANSKSASVNSA